MLIPPTDVLEEEEMAEDSLSSSEEENCRKKRCHDRYDSSESSDRQVPLPYSFN
jgi:hypothetical protein